MTPRRLDPDRVAVKLQLMRTALDVLDEIGDTDSFVAAARAGAIPEPLPAALAPAVGLRNVLIHDYAAIDLERVAAAIPLARRDFARYVAAVATFVRGGGGPQGALD